MADGHPATTAALLETDTYSLSREQTAVAFALVDHLMETDPGALNTIVARLRARTPTRDAVKEVLGLDPDPFLERFRAWVLDTYPAR